MKKRIRLGCPNQNCENYRRNVKFKGDAKDCPECGTQLVHVCKRKKCRTMVESDQEVYCVLCKAEKDDRKAAVGKGAAGAGAVAVGVGVKYRRELLEVAKTIPKLLLKK